MSPLWETNLRRSSRRFEAPFVRSASVCFHAILFSIFRPHSLIHAVLRDCSSSSRRQMLPEILPPLPPPFFRTSCTKGDHTTIAIRRHSSVIVRWRRRRQRHVRTRYPENIGNLSGLLCHPTSACSICFFCFYLWWTSEQNSEFWIDKAVLCLCHPIAIYFRPR